MISVVLLPMHQRWLVVVVGWMFILAASCITKIVALVFRVVRGLATFNGSAQFLLAFPAKNSADVLGPIMKIDNPGSLTGITPHENARIVIIPNMCYFDPSIERSHY